MRKYIGYLPVILFSTFYLLAGLTGSNMAIAMILIWLACFLFAAVLLHKGIIWGGVFGVFPAVHMIYRGGEEILVGIALLLFYLVLGIYLWKKRDTRAPATSGKEVLIFFAKIALTGLVLVMSAYIAVLGGMLLVSEGVHQAFVNIGMLVFPSLALPLIWLKKRKEFFLVWLIPAVVFFISLGINYGMVKYDESITINTSPNINVHEYLPFDEDSKIVKYDSKTLKLTDNLPKIDGAAALFPVYSAFVNAVYPDTTKLYDGTFEYNNTPRGYRLLAEKETDIFIGVYPSDEQKAYAEEWNTTFVYTPIGSEAFVFFVHKDNPIDNLTTEQIQGIYSGEITNWKQVGGKDEEIAAFQRNEGSGSQSMLERFMGDKPIMEAPTELVNDLMVGIIERVSNYKSKSNSIGFSFRFYVEGIIKNPDIKMISIDGVAPTAENVKNGTYQAVTPIYAVTYEEQTNENVDKLLDWILSEEGQYITEETGYVGIMPSADIMVNNYIKDISPFSEFLDNEKFVPRMSQEEFKDQMGKYSYEGTPVLDIIAGFFYDGLQGGGFAAGGEHFGFKNDYTAEDNVANYSNRIWTKVQLEGLTLPYGIDFDDSLSEVFQKMESTINPYSAFYADENSTTDMTLYSDEKAKLVFQDLKRTQVPVEYEMPYVLIYSEAYTTQLDDGRPDTVERTIKLSFSDKDGTADTLELFEMRVAERYEIKKY